MALHRQQCRRAARARCGPVSFRQWSGPDGSSCRAVWSAADCSDGYHYTAPVGSLAATGPGLNDLFGNLWEWVDSCEPDFSSATPVFGACDSDAPRILRGGSWSDRPEMLALDAKILS